MRFPLGFAPHYFVELKMKKKKRKMKKNKSQSFHRASAISTKPRSFCGGYFDLHIQLAYLKGNEMDGHGHYTSTTGRDIEL